MQPIRVSTKNLLLAVIAFALCFSVAAYAAVPTQLSYQGRLQDSGGNPLDGTYGMTFTIYDSPTGGTVLWTESQIGVIVTNGLFARRPADVLLLGTKEGVQTLT